MALQPIAKLGSLNAKTLLELPDKIVLNNIVYDKVSLSLPSDFYPAKFQPTTNYDFGHYIPTYKGGQFMLYTGVGRAVQDTVTVNPNLNPEYSTIFETDTNYCFVYCGPNDFVAFSKEDYTPVFIIQNDSSRPWRRGIGVKITETDVLGLCGWVDYDKFALFRRFNMETGRGIHNERSAVNYGLGGFLHHDASFVYAYASFDWNGKSWFRIYRYDISQQSATIILNKDVCSNKTNVIPTQFLDESTDTIKYMIVPGKSNNKVTLNLVTLDVQQSKATIDTILQSLPDGLTYNVNDSRYILQAFIAKDGAGNKYIILLFKQRTDVSYNDDNIHVYKIQSLDVSKKTITLQKVGSYKVGSRFTAVTFLDSLHRNTFLALTDKRLISITVGNDTIDAQPLALSNVYSTYYDTVGRLWIFTTESNVYLLTPNVPTLVNIEFEKDQYIYTGTDITTSLSVDTYNFLGQRVAVNGTLRILSNNATFEGGSKVKDITTSATSTTSVPIIITGAGIVDVSFEFRP